MAAPTHLPRGGYESTAMVRKTALSKRRASGCPCCAPGQAGPFSLGRALDTAHSEAVDLYGALGDDEPVAVSSAAESEPPRSETEQPQGGAPADHAGPTNALFRFSTPALTTPRMAMVLAAVATTVLVAATAYKWR